MKRTRLVPSVLLAAATPLLLVGCSGSPTSPSATAGSASAARSTAGGAAAATRGPAMSPVSALMAASDATGRAGSMRIALTSEVGAGGAAGTVSVKGEVDNPRRLARMTFALGANGQKISIEERIVGDSLYVAIPQQPGTFFKISISDLTGTSLADSADPTAGFQALRAASSDVKEVGREQVRDASTRHFTGTYDLKAALGKVKGAAKGLLTTTLKQSVSNSVPFDAYVDDQGRVRKMVQRLSVRVPGTTKPQRVTTTVEAYDFGIPVTVAAPPASKVRDGAPLLKGLRQQQASA